MASLNLVNLTCSIKRMKYRAPGWKSNAGKTMTFPTMSLWVSLPNDRFYARDEQGQFVEVLIEGQDAWVDIGVPTIRGSGNGDRESPDENRIRRMESGISQGYVYCLVAQAKIGLRGGQDPKLELKASFGDLRLSNAPLPTLNDVTIYGDVINQEGDWLIIEDRYRAKEEWKSRSIPVLVQNSVPAVRGKRVLVKGRLATRDWNGNQALYVVATEVV